MLPSIPRPEDYDVSPVHGFLPSCLPLERLPHSYYAQWETVASNLQGLILSKRLRGIVDGMPVLSTNKLNTEAEWRRAYVVLAFVAHAYIWSGEQPCERVPPPLSIPFLSICAHLELPPVATYAGVCLWNWKPIFPDEPIDTLENLSTLLTFTGALDESWFYLVSVAIEARAGPLIPMMIEAIAAARERDAKTVTECLRALAEGLDGLAGILQRMYEQCDPHVFYHRIRPFLAGSKNMAEAGLPRGVIFDTGSGKDAYVQYSGGSNAQSSVIQFFDLVLGIEHRPTGEHSATANEKPESQKEGTGPPPPSHNFIVDMRRYMPGPHRRFLEHVASVSNIAPFVRACPGDAALCNAYDACLAMLRAFRDKHIQMVSRYIILKSKGARPYPSQATGRPGSQSTGEDGSHQATTNGGKKSLRGTGGTALIPFLKQARDETGEPAIGAWARRILSNSPASSASLSSSAAGLSGSRDGRGMHGKSAGGLVGSRDSRAMDGRRGLSGDGDGDDDGEAAFSLKGVQEMGNGDYQIVGLAGTWSVGEESGGICHW